MIGGSCPRQYQNISVTRNHESSKLFDGEHDTNNMKLFTLHDDIGKFVVSETERRRLQLDCVAISCRDMVIRAQLEGRSGEQNPAHVLKTRNESWQTSQRSSFQHLLDVGKEAKVIL